MTDLALVIPEPNDHTTITSQDHITDLDADASVSPRATDRIDDNRGSAPQQGIRHLF
jgi:hypothetical protein